MAQTIKESVFIAPKQSVHTLNSCVINKNK